jgi:alpha-1,2-mannosyltransferase
LNSTRPSQRRRIATLLAFGLARILLGLWNAPRAGTTTSTYGNDFTVFYAAAERIVQTGNPYDIAIREHTPYLYPPLFAHLLAPLTWLSLSSASIVWALGNCLAFGLLFSISFRTFKTDTVGPRIAWLVAFIPLLLGNLALGQVNLWIALLVAIALQRDLERRTPWSAGLALALAISIKLTPAVFLIHFAARRSWKTLGWSAVWGIALNGLSFLALGPERMAILNGWFSEIVVNGWKFNFAVSGNQSLIGAAMRFFTNARTDAPRFPSVTILDCGPAFSLVQLALIGTALGLCAWQSWRTANDSRAAHAAAFAACVCLLVSKLSWVVHFAMLALPLALLANESFKPTDRRAPSRWILAISTVCLWSGFRFVPEIVRVGSEAFSAFTCVAVAIALYCLTLRTTTPSDCSEAPRT